VQPAFRDRPALLALTVSPARPAQRALKELQVRKGPKDPQGSPAPLVPRVQPAPRDLQELLVQLAPTASRV